MLRVTCPKCNRAGQYPVARLIERYGADAGLPDWKDGITALLKHQLLRPKVCLAP